MFFNGANNCDTEIATARSQWSGGIEFSPASYKLYEGAKIAWSQMHLAILA